MKAKWPTFKVLESIGIYLSAYNYACMMCDDGYFPQMVEEYLRSCDDVSYHRRPLTDAEIEKAVRDAYSDALTPSRKEIRHE